MVIGFVISFHLFWQMSMESSTFIGFTDGASLHTQNSYFPPWVIYTPMGQVLSSRVVFLWPSLKNIVEYSVVIELLCDSISHGIRSLEVRLDSQLVVSQLNGSYRIRDPVLLRRFLRVRLLERQFENITYIHVPRVFNQVVDPYSNYVLDWHFFHRP